MQLLLISNMYPSQNYPGYGIFVRNVVDNLSQYGVQCKDKAVIIGRKKSVIEKIISYLNLYLKITWYYIFKHYDGIYIHFPNQVSPLLLILYTIKSTNLILNLHGEDLMYRQHGIAKILGKCCEQLVHKSNLIIVPSDYFKTIIQKRSLCNLDKVFVSPSGGIDNRYLFPSTTMRYADSIRIGYVGRLEYDKGVFDLILSLHQIQNKIKYQVVIVGYGSIKNKIEEYIKLHHLDLQITLEGGIEQNKLGAVYNNIDVLIFPSKRESESLGLVGIEAMACGTPVIGTNIGGIPSYLKNEYNGLLVPVGDIDALSNAIIKFAQLTFAQRKEMRENAIKTAQRYYRDNVIKELARKITNTIKN